MKKLKCYNFDIVFQEIPDNITLSINISGCPNRCKGCHSPWLWKDEGIELNEHLLTLLIDKYLNDITCVCFMGGDQSPEQIDRFAALVRELYPSLKTAWYSGVEQISPQINIANFDYIKIGPYLAERGGLRSPDTNQKFFKVLDGGVLEQYFFSPKNAF